MDSQGSVTRLIEQLRSDNPSVREDAARGLWERYVPALLELAASHPDGQALLSEHRPALSALRAGLEEAGMLPEYQAAIEAAYAASAKIAAGAAPEAAASAHYLLPLATRVRCLFKMDFAEAQYITELRSAPAGHFSYRRVAWEMFLALERQHPALARHIRVTDFTQPIDLFQR